VIAFLMALVAVLPSASPTVAQDATAQPWIWPTSGKITQPYGCTGFYAEPRRGSCAHFHNGIDIANDRGTPIRAVADGTVKLVGWDPWIHPDPDWMVIIDHGNGIQTM
jgi:murein DD-endopeptidase MepM/ murein hydrolase activator NlpD